MRPRPSATPRTSSAPRADADVTGMRVGIVRDLLDLEGVTPEVRQSVLDAAARFEAMGATVGEVDLPTSKHGLVGVLHHRAGGGVVEPRALRRHPLRPPRREPHRRARSLHALARRGVRCRGQAPDHARHLRAVRRLLRRLLRPGAEGAHGDRERVQLGLRAVRRAAHSHEPSGRMEVRREGRPAGHVPGRHLHDPREPRRQLRHQRALRLLGRTAGPGFPSACRSSATTSPRPRSSGRPRPSSATWRSTCEVRSSAG